MRKVRNFGRKATLCRSISFSSANIHLLFVKNYRNCGPRNIQLPHRGKQGHWTSLCTSFSTTPNTSIASNSGYWMQQKLTISSTAVTSIEQKGYSASAKERVTGYHKAKLKECFSKQSPSWQTELKKMIYYATC